MPVIENDIYGKHRTEPPPTLVSGEEEYEVEAILNHRVKKKRSKNRRLTTEIEFLVRWEGYGPTEDSWENEANLTNTDELLRQYKETNNLR
jgi:hypothetical protein